MKIDKQVNVGATAAAKAKAQNKESSQSYMAGGNQKREYFLCLLEAI